MNEVAKLLTKSDAVLYEPARHPIERHFWAMGVRDCYYDEDRSSSYSEKGRVDYNIGWTAMFNARFEQE